MKVTTSAPVIEVRKLAFRQPCERRHHPALLRDELFRGHADSTTRTPCAKPGAHSTILMSSAARNIGAIVCASTYTVRSAAYRFTGEVAFPARPQEYDVARRHLLRKKAEAAQQMGDSGLYLLPPGWALAPALVAIFRPDLGLLLQYLPRVPCHGLPRLDPGVAAGVETEDVERARSGECGAAGIEHRPRLVAEFPGNGSGEVFDRRSFPAAGRKFLVRLVFHPVSVTVFGHRC